MNTWVLGGLSCSMTSDQQQTREAAAGSLATWCRWHHFNTLQHHMLNRTLIFFFNKWPVAFTSLWTFPHWTSKWGKAEEGETFPPSRDLSVVLHGNYFTPKRLKLTERTYDQNHGQNQDTSAAFPSYGSIGPGCLVTQPGSSEISHKRNSHATAALLQQRTEVMEPKLETHLKQEYVSSHSKRFPTHKSWSRQF